MDIVSKCILCMYYLNTLFTHTPCDIEKLKTRYSDRRVAESVALTLVTQCSVVYCVVYVSGLHAAVTPHVSNGTRGWGGSLRQLAASDHFMAKACRAANQ